MARHRRRHGLLAVAFAQVRFQALLRCLGLHEHDPRRLAVDAVGPIFMRSTSSFSRLSGTSRGCQALMRARLQKQLLQRGIIQPRGHDHRPAQ